ncbi:MAG: hypothetical protein EOO39_42275, partial [Cytophagaceae bacterium]
QNWSLAINGITVGNGNTTTGGGATGTLNVASAVSGLTGTVNAVLTLTGNTGGGTYRLDDFTLNGSVTLNCTGSTITSFTPLEGPQNTLVTITGSGFQSGSGTLAVLFNGIASSFQVISNTQIKAYIPAGNTSGPITVNTNGCPVVTTTPFTQLVSVANQNYSPDIYISELYDAQAGDGGVIEIYNGTNTTINLAGYTIRRYGQIGDMSSFYTINLTGILAPGQIYLVGIGGGPTPCGVTSGQDYPTGFNSDDEFELYNGATLIDNVHTPDNVGFSMIRNPNAVAPKTVFSAPDWNISNTENCANIGIHTVSTVNPPSITSPTSAAICENNSAVFSVSLANPTTYTYQWKMVNTGGTWSNVPNATPYTGANTSTLTISPTPLAFDDSQFYCEATSV